ncbi:hypothetical protein [Novosphingobium guangzhouense]|uniref:hypothetical protein n=1 Tax=Novosphingobium guangzhouense TaxID=1850347 RepID=UPI0011AFC79D|nr:hypothetical protein [Novosphingobium guangzhouense]
MILRLLTPCHHRRGSQGRATDPRCRNPYQWRNSGKNDAAPDENIYDRYVEIISDITIALTIEAFAVGLDEGWIEGPTEGSINKKLTQHAQDLLKD